MKKALRFLTLGPFPVFDYLPQNSIVIANQKEMLDDVLMRRFDLNKIDLPDEAKTRELIKLTLKKDHSNLTNRKT